MPTLQVIFDRLCNDKLKGSIVSTVVMDSLAAQSLTSAAFGLDTAAPSNDRVGYWIHRPLAATSPDFSRRVSAYDNTLGKWTHAGAAYADITPTGETTWRIIPEDPQVIYRCINNGLDKLRYRDLVLLSEANDGDMEAAGTTAYTATTTTLTKDTTASRINHGAQALRSVTTAANGYASQAINTIPLTVYRVAVAVVSTNSGTARLRTLDGNSAQLYAYDIQANRMVVVMYQVATPAGTAGLTLNVRLQGVENGAAHNWDDLLVWRSQRREIGGQDVLTMPTWIDAPGQVQGLVLRRYRYGIQSAAMTYFADDFDDVRLFPNRDYIEPTAANPTTLVLRDQLPANCIPYLDCYRPYASLGTTETNVTACPLNLAVEAAYAEYLAYKRNQADISEYGTYDRQIAIAVGNKNALARHYQPVPHEGVRGPWSAGRR